MEKSRRVKHLIIGGVAGGATAGFHKDQLGHVHLKGTITGGIATAGFNILTLPPEYRPSEVLNFSVATSTTLGSVSIEPNGRVRFGTGTNASLFLDDIPPFKATL